MSNLITINNPINTESQIQHELQALEIYNLKEIQEQKELVRSFWLDLVKPSEVMMSCFDDAFEEVMFGAVIWALNQDPNFPKVVTISRVPHKINNQNIPGSRWGIDNPDSVYQVYPEPWQRADLQYIDTDVFSRVSINGSNNISAPISVYVPVPGSLAIHLLSLKHSIES